jgi:hypothetical protein
MAIDIDGDLNAGVPQLLRDILDRGMVLIELDRRVAVPKIVNPVATQACTGTDTLMDFIESGG